MGGGRREGVGADHFQLGGGEEGVEAVLGVPCLVQQLSWVEGAGTDHLVLAGGEGGVHIGGDGVADL